MGLLGLLQEEDTKEFDIVIDQFKDVMLHLRSFSHGGDVMLISRLMNEILVVGGCFLMEVIPPFALLVYFLV